MFKRTRRHKLKSASGYVSKNGCEWDSNPYQPETYSGIEATAILKHRTALFTQPLQLGVDSGTLTYKNVNFRHRLCS